MASPSCSVTMELFPSVDRVTRNWTREEATGPTNSYLRANHNKMLRIVVLHNIIYGYYGNPFGN